VEIEGDEDQSTGINIQLNRRRFGNGGDVADQHQNDETKPISSPRGQMSSFRQIEANRRNARLSTGPVTEERKRRSRQNVLRHGLTAETVSTRWNMRQWP
jgi:hypothetical protein